MAAGAMRFDMSLPLTGGLDSRLLLAATRDIADTLSYHTLRYRDLTPESDDLRIPAKLLKQLNLPHDIVDCTAPAPTWFQETFADNALPSHVEEGATIAYGVARSHLRDKIAVIGCCPEVARCFYYRFGTHEPITSIAPFLAIERGWGDIPFIRDHLTRWFNALQSSNHGVDLFDLFYWEHRVGGFMAHSQLEQSIAYESFMPFNHRRMLSLLLSAPTKSRVAPHYRLYKALLKRMWPETLAQPINPVSTRQALGDRLRYMLGRMGLYEATRKLSAQIKHRRP